MKKLESTDPRIQEALVLYKTGKGIKLISKLLHLHDEVIRRFIIEAGLLRTRSQAIRNCKSDAEINDDALDILTSEALYWLGFLYTDGSIEKDKRTRLNLTLAEKDKRHLEKYNNFFSNGKLILRDVTPKNPKKYPKGQINFGGKYWRVSFSSKKIHDRLKELGFTHNKTLNLIPSELLKYSRDFWRGCIDGDGHVCMTGDTRANGKYNYACIGLSGTKDTLDGFLVFIRSASIITETVPRKAKDTNVWKLDIHGTGAKKVLDLLYKDSTVYLDRKYQKYLEIQEEDPKN